MPVRNGAVSQIGVVGGGPAGLASAIALAQTGFRVTVFDRAQPPIEKACGEGLMPDSVEVLNRLGIRIPEGIGFAFRGIRFADQQSSVAADFPRGQGIGVRRVVLHDLLLRRAEQLGVECVWGAARLHVAPHRIDTGSLTRSFDFIVAADGQNSACRRVFGLAGSASSKRRYGFRRHYRLAPWSPYVEVYWGNNFQIYISPVAEDEVCVISISRSSGLRLDQALRQFPSLLARLRDAEPLTRETGALSTTRRLHRVVSSNVALVGDASGSVDAITGEGLCLSFKQSLALADALQAEDLRRYRAAHSRLGRRPHLMGALLLTLDQYPALQRRALASLSRCPQLFAAFLAIHVGEASPGRLVSPQLLTFCREFVTA